MVEVKTGNYNISEIPFTHYPPGTIIALRTKDGVWMGSTKARLDPDKMGPYPPAHLRAAN